MNELQIRLSADIKQFQAAMAQVESRLERAENILKKAQVSADRYRGALATLAGQFKRGEISQEQYNKGAEKLSSSLIKQEGIISNTTREVDRLNKEYKRMNTSSLVQGQNQLASSSDNLSNSLRGTNSVSNSLSRTFRDLPGGITPLFENVRQLIGNFSSLTKTAGGVGPAIAQSFSAFATPANIALLAVTALTAAFTAYQMGAFKSKEETRDLEAEMDNFRKTLDSVRESQLKGAGNAEKEIQTFKLLKSQAENANVPLEKRIEAVKELQQKYPEYLGNLSQEEILTGNVGGAYENLTKQIIATAKARAASDAIAENSLKLLTLEEQTLEKSNEILKAREKLESVRNSQRFATGQDLVALKNQEAIQQGRINDLVQDQLDLVGQRTKIQDEDARLQARINELIQEGATFTQAKIKATQELKKANEDYFNSFSISDDDILKRLQRNLEMASKDTKITEVKIPINFVPEGDILPDGIIQELRNKIASLTAARDVATDPTRISEYNEQLKVLETQLSTFTGNVKQNAKELKSDLELIANAFSGMSFQVSEALGISNRNLRAFVGTVISNAPKIISAIMAQAKAAQAAAVITNTANLAQAKGNAVVSATAAAKGLGPVGLALLPVFIAGALALVAGAFGKGGGGKSGGGASPSISGKSQSFGNLPQPTRQEMRDQSTSSSNRPNGPNRLEAVVTGDQIRFVLDQSGRRTGRG